MPIGSCPPIRHNSEERVSVFLMMFKKLWKVVITCPQNLVQSWLCNFAAKTTDILCCIRKSTAEELVEVILPLHSSLLQPVLLPSLRIFHYATSLTLQPKLPSTSSTSPALIFCETQIQERIPPCHRKSSNH